MRPGEDVLMHRLRHLPPLAPPARLGVRLQQSLEAGFVVAQASAAAPAHREGRRAGPVLAGIAAVVAVMLLWPKRETAPPVGEEVSWLVPRAALAQGVATGWPPLAALVPARMRAGTWTYHSRTRGPDGFEQDLGETRLTVAAGALAGDSVWIMTRSGRGRVGRSSTDSVVVRLGTLAPVSRSRVPSGWTMAFRGDSVMVDLPRRGFRREWRLPVIEREPYLVELATLLPAVPLAPGFQAGVSILAVFSPEGPLLPLAMKVEGQEVVTVPAGTFRCYRVRIGGAADGDVWWVDSESGRLVKTARTWSGDMKDETVLTAAR